MPSRTYLPTLLAGLAVLAGAAFALWGSSPQTRSKLGREVALLAGPEATDCGWVRQGKDGSAAAECAQAALREGKPFHVLFETADSEARTIVGLAHKAGAPVMQVSYRREGWDTGSFLPSTIIEVQPCPHPSATLRALSAQHQSGGGPPTSPRGR